MNQIRKIIKDLDKGVAPRKNLPIYANYLADTYLNYASIELVFSAYMLVETCQEGIDLSEPLYNEEFPDVPLITAYYQKYEILPFIPPSFRRKSTICFGYDKNCVESDNLYQTKKRDLCIFFFIE